MAPNRRKCTGCGGDSVYRRIYSGENLCRGCFKSSILEKTRRTISKYDMMKHGDKVVVAISGGKDSLSLLEVLSRLTPRHGEEIVAITVDEGIKEYRGEATTLARRMASKLSVEHEVVSFRSLFGFTLDEAIDMRGDQRVTACSICGVLRRRAIDLAAELVGADVVVTGHNLDDFLQTYFINLTNGDLGRLEFLNPNFEARMDIPRRVKPFIEIYEEEIAFYAYLSDIPFQTNPCPYMDEGIRTEIRSFLNNLERRHSGIKHSTFNTALKLTTHPQLPQRRTLRCERCGHPSSDTICSTCRTIHLIRNKQLED